MATETTNYVDHLEFERKQGCCHTNDLDTKWWDDWIPGVETEYVASNFTCNNCPHAQHKICTDCEDLHKCNHCKYCCKCKDCCQIQGCSKNDVRNGLPLLDGACKYFDFGGASSIFLDGFIAAQHSGN